MSIKQQGGIFGRNPTFNNVTVDGDLDVQGGVTAPNIEITGGTIDNTVIGGTTAAAISGTTGSFSDNLTLSAGNLLVGTTSAGGGTPSDPIGVSLLGESGSAKGVGLFVRDSPNPVLFVNNKTFGGDLVRFFNGGNSVGKITSDGTSTSYGTSSDYRLKEDVQPMVGASDRVLALNPVNFAWKSGGSRVDGFLAHEAQEVVPEAVTGEKDGEEMQAIDQSKLVPLLTAALQDALKRIEALEGDPE